MASALIHLRVDNNYRDRSILTDMAILRKEGLATDTRVIVMEEAEGGLKKSCTNPILAHSVVLAAASPALAALLASVGEASEEFTLVLVGVERTQAEQAIKDIYLGKVVPDNVLLGEGSNYEDGGDRKDGHEDDTGRYDPDVVQIADCSIADLDGIVRSEDYEEVEENVSEGEMMADGGTPERGDFSEAGDVPGNAPSLDESQEIKEEKGGKYNLQQNAKKYSKEAATAKAKKICPICGKGVLPKTLKSHMLRNHPQRTFVCDQCDYRTHVEDSLKYHMQAKHGGVRHVCEECGKDFAHKFILTQHIQDKHSEKTHFCDQCDYTFKGQSGQLETHRRLKHSNAILICPYCDFYSATKEAIDEHRESNHKYQTTPKKSSEAERKIREAHKEFICHICNISKKSRTTLNLHIRSEHKGIRYNCSIEGCSFSGKQKNQLKAHMNAIHLKIKLPCDFCDFKTAQSSNLVLHMMKKHGVQPFSCDKCDFRCHKSNKMKHHMLHMH